MFKKSISVVVILSILITCFASVHAHPAIMGNDYSYGEEIGWSIHEDFHCNSKNINYKFNVLDENLTDSYKDIVRNGALKWNPYGTISEVTGSSSATPLIVVETFYNTSGIYASTCNTVMPDDYGHISYWQIQLNTEMNLTSSVCAHEFGHVYGLSDLYNYENYNKLMCGYGDVFTATSPTTSDIKGYNVIVGNHRSHSFRYSRVPGAQENIPVHRKYCSICNMYRDEGCSPSSGTCSYCKCFHL